MRIILFFIVFFFLSACSDRVLSDKVLPNTLSGVTIIEAPHWFDISYDSWAVKTIKEYYASWSVVINGSYFGVTDWGVYYPAGLWESESTVCCTMYLSRPNGWWIPIDTSTNGSDPNLTFVVGISANGEVKIFPREALKGNVWPYKNAFQAWPLVLSGGILQDFWRSWHAQEKHERTLMGKTFSGKILFFIFTDKVTLGEVGEIISKDPRFTRDPVTLLNLDGWPSTAYYDGVRGFREDVRLPIIFKILK